MEDLALHILDIAQNSLEAGATEIRLEIEEDPGADRLTIRVRDNGRGMSRDAARASVGPFVTTRTTRRVGMGLPLLRRAAEAAGGGLAVDSRPGRGTEVTATFQWNHLDRAPLGDLETTMVALAAPSPGVDVVLSHRVGGRGYTLSSQDVLAALDGGALDSAGGLGLIRAAVRRGEAALASDATAGPGGSAPAAGAAARGGSHD